MSTEKVSPNDWFLCESGGEVHCGHSIPIATYDALESWIDDYGDDDLYIVRSDCAEGFTIVQRYGNYCVIRDARD